jgi:ferredoxin
MRQSAAFNALLAFLCFYLSVSCAFIVYSSVARPLESSCCWGVRPAAANRHHHRPAQRHIDALFASSAQEDESGDTDGIDVSVDDRLYRIRLPRAPGIEWGTDLSFTFVYVREIDPSGPALLSGKIEKGDQLCELRPVTSDMTAPAVNLLGAPFDFVMDAFANLDRGVKEMDLVFFRGTKAELKALATGDTSKAEPDTVTITVVQNKGAKDESIRKIEAPVGANMRKVCVDNGINVYQSVTRWTNCKGKQLCGTCIVNVTDGAINTNRKSMDEESTLRENPDSYRLSCITFAYGDVTIETFPPVNPAQWTR